MDNRCKVIITNKNIYKEIELSPNMTQLKAGTSSECDIRLRKDWFFESIELTFIKMTDSGRLYVQTIFIFLKVMLESSFLSL